MKYYITINWKYSEINNMKIRNIIIMITKMITMREKEIIATKKVLIDYWKRNCKEFTAVPFQKSSKEAFIHFLSLFSCHF